MRAYRAAIAAKKLQANHSKMREIEYSELKTQPYLVSPLRSRSVECKAHFKGRHGDDLDCSLCHKGQDDQPHILRCYKLNEQLNIEKLAKKNVEYRDIFSDTYKQKEAIVLISRLLKIREKLQTETNK